MFERVTINEVSTSEKASIAFTLLKPRGWALQQEESWVAFRPYSRPGSAFIVMMPGPNQRQEVPHLFEGEAIEAYLRGECTELTELDESCTADERNLYETRCFHCKLDGVDGRYVVLATAVPVEDVVFTLIGLSLDERFHSERFRFSTMMASFQPVVTGALGDK